MLPQGNKLRSSRDFTMTVRRGRRIGRKTLVLHILDAGDVGGEIETDMKIARFGGPRIGLVVSKAVGNAVTRHAVSRKLRHVMAEVAEDLPPTMDIVVRALPAASTSSSEEFSQDVHSAIASYYRRQGRA